MTNASPLERPVVDASVAVKWYLTAEIHAEAADRLLRDSRQLLVPDLFFPEIGNIVWKQVRKGEMTDQEALAIVRSLGHLGLLTFPAQTLLVPAVEIACRTGRTVYDSLYLALAIQERSVMVTADEKFFHALQDTPYASFLLWIENIPLG